MLIIFMLRLHFTDHIRTNDIGFFFSVDTVYWPWIPERTSLLLLISAVDICSLSSLFWLKIPAKSHIELKTANDTKHLSFDIYLC